MRISFVVILAFCGLLALEPAARLAAMLTRGEAAEIAGIFKHPLTPKSLRQLEDSLEQGSPLVQSSRPLLQAARFLALRDGGAKLLVGDGGWWFYKPAVEYLNRPFSKEQGAQALEAVFDFQRQLRSRGIELVFVLMPDKASVQSEALGAQGAAVHSSRFLEELRAGGVTAPDLFTLFAREKAPYLKRDTHWAPGAVELAAREVAKEVRRLLPAALESHGYRTQDIVVEREGDLLRMLEAPMLLRRFPPESVECRQVFDAEGHAFKPAAEAPVLVLGDSFLRVYELDAPGSGGFTAHLAAELQMPVAAIINDGGAANLVRENLARRPGLLKAARIVVWEVAERDLGLAEGGWKRVALSAP